MKYVAFLRGIGPGNPNMQNSKLCGVFEDLGFEDVQSVISSGNIIFKTDRTDVKSMESELEAAWVEKLGFASATIIKSKDELQKLVKLNPFGKMTHGKTSYLMVTFSKKPIRHEYPLPYQPQGKTYQALGATKHAFFTTTDNTLVKTTDLMTWLEKQFGKQITSRTWLTIQRCLSKLNS